jgi:hypothetical protein
MDIMAGDSRTLKLSILADVDDLNKKLKQATGDVEGFGGKMANVGKKIGVALAAAAAAAGAMAVKIGIDAVKAASNLAETQSKVGVIFGESADAINKFAATAATKLGQSKQQALDAASTFATFGKSAGLAGDDLVGFSTELTTLSADLASFYNTSPEEAITAIGAALRGESEPIRKYGILLNDAALKQEAMTMGIYNGSGALTAQQKVLAAQAVIMKQSTDAQGDFARTSDGLANQQRILAAQFENVKSTIGTALLPVVLELVGAFNRNVLPAIVKVSDAIGEGGLTGYITNIKDNIRNFFVPVLEGLKSAWDKISDALSRNSESFQKLASFITNVVSPALGTTLKFALEIVGSVFGRIIDIIGGSIDKISSFVEAVKNMVNAVISAYNRLPTPDIGLIGAGGSAGAPGSISGGGAFTGSSSSGMAGGSGSGSGAGTFGGGSAGGGAGGGGGGAGGTAPVGATSMLKLVDRLTDISDKFTDLQFLVDTGGISRKAGVAELNKLTKEFDVLSAQADRLVATQVKSDSAASVTTYNLNFNGIVGDPEGVKRQLVDLMNDSSARGTLGAEGFTK